MYIYINIYIYIDVYIYIYIAALEAPFLACHSLRVLGETMHMNLCML